MVSTLVLKAKNTSSVFTVQDILELIEFSSFIKAYAKSAALLHNSCINGSPMSEYQATLKRSKNHAQNQFKLALRALEAESSDINNAEVSKWKVDFESLKKQIQDDKDNALKQYQLIRQSNWVFVTVFELLRKDAKLASKAKFGHTLDDSNHPVLVIEFEGHLISCPKGFTNLELDSDGFNEQLFYEVIQPVMVDSDNTYTGITEVTGFRPNLVVQISESRKKYIRYDVK